MSVKLAKLDTATIRRTLSYTGGRVYSENRSYGRRIKFWYTEMPLNGDVVACNKLLADVFGSRFISCNNHSSYEFEVQLKAFA